jgi:hypothetical protein
VLLRSSQAPTTFYFLEYLCIMQDQPHLRLSALQADADDRARARALPNDIDWMRGNENQTRNGPARRDPPIELVEATKSLAVSTGESTVDLAREQGGGTAEEAEVPFRAALAPIIAHEEPPFDERRKVE